MTALERDGRAAPDGTSDIDRVVDALVDKEILDRRRAPGGRSAPTSSARSPTARSPRPTGPSATPASPTTSRRHLTADGSRSDRSVDRSPTTTRRPPSWRASSAPLDRFPADLGDRARRAGSSEAARRASEARGACRWPSAVQPGARPGRAANHRRRRLRLLLGRAARSDRGLRELSRPHGSDVAEAADGRARSADAPLASAAARMLVLGEIEQKGAKSTRPSPRCRRGRGCASPSSATTPGLAEALRQRGMTRALRRPVRGGRAVDHRRPRRVPRQLGDRGGEAWALQNLAWIAFVGGRADEAEGRLQAVGEHVRARSATRAAWRGPRAAGLRALPAGSAPRRRSSLARAGPRRGTASAATGGRPG